MESSKGSRDGQFFHRFPHTGNDRLPGESAMHHRSGTTVTIQGGVSSSISLNRLAVLLAGMSGKTAPRRSTTDRNP